MNIVDCNGLSFRASAFRPYRRKWSFESRKIFRDRETCYFRGPSSTGILHLKQLLFSADRMFIGYRIIVIERLIASVSFPLYASFGHRVTALIQFTRSIFRYVELD